MNWFVFLIKLGSIILSLTKMRIQLDFVKLRSYSALLKATQSKHSNNAPNAPADQSTVFLYLWELGRATVFVLTIILNGFFISVMTYVEFLEVDFTISSRVCCLDVEEQIFQNLLLCKAKTPRVPMKEVTSFWRWDLQRTVSCLTRFEEKET